MKNLLLLCLFFITISSCTKKPIDKKNPTDYTREDFIGSYTFNYSQQVIINSQGGLQLSDTTYFGSRTIYIMEPSSDNGCPIIENRIALKNLKGNNNIYCAKITNNTYKINDNIAEGQGTLVDDKLTLNINTPYGGITKDNTKGSATKD